MKDYVAKPAGSILSDDFFQVSVLRKISSFDIETPVNFKDSIELNYGDTVNTYIYNSDGYRSIEFKPIDLIMAGCSYTFGVGIPVECIWSSVLATSLGEEHVNVSHPGWSAKTIVKNLLNYFYKYGNPRTLFVLFPDYGRIEATSRQELSTIRYGMDGGSNIFIGDIILNTDAVETRPKYSKRPHVLQDIISPEQGAVEAISYINILISYCKAAKIELIWSTWNQEFGVILDTIKKTWNQEEYKNYVSMEHKLNNCHQEYLKKYGNNFHMGQDKLEIENYVSHHGIHPHLHYAEIFLAKLDKIRNGS
jgi:hypothetical protein